MKASIVECTLLIYTFQKAFTTANRHSVPIWAKSLDTGPTRKKCHYVHLDTGMERVKIQWAYWSPNMSYYIMCTF